MTNARSRCLFGFPTMCLALALLAYLSGSTVASVMDRGPAPVEATLSSAGASQQGDSKATTLVHLHLNGVLLETPIVDQLGLTGDQYMSLKDLLALFKKAREDEDIAGMVLTIDQFQFGLAQMEELHQMFGDFRGAGKKLFVHVDYFSMPSYALFSNADLVGIVPTADLWLTGFYGESLYVKGLLDKIGVQADILQMGDYKSAGELFTRAEPSPAALENVNWLLDGLYDHYVGLMADGRKMNVQRMKDLIDDGPYSAEKARRVGLVDAVQFRKDFLKTVEEQYDGDVRFENRYDHVQDQAIDMNNPFAFFSILSRFMTPPKDPTEDAIAVVYVEGPILPGYRQPDPFNTSQQAYSGDLRHALEKAAADDTVKAVVLRVNSPGGSALASEIILEASRKVQQRKPLIVSMGNVAGSGGYYVTCAADTVFADKATITGSIGVIGGKFVTKSMWDKLGISWYPHQRGANADMLNSSRPFDENQRARLKDWMQEIYEEFKQHVVKARADKLARPIDQLAGGRVYTGQQAFELGLVDHIGGFRDALAYAARKADISDYEIRIIPEPVDMMTQMMSELMGVPQEDKPTDVSLSVFRSFGSSQWLDAPQILGALQRLEPQRTQILFQALQRLDLLQQESVITMMPSDWIIR